MDLLYSAKRAIYKLWIFCSQKKYLLTSIKSNSHLSTALTYFFWEPKIKKLFVNCSLYRIEQVHTRASPYADGREEIKLIEQFKEKYSGRDSDDSAIFSREKHHTLSVKKLDEKKKKKIRESRLRRYNWLRFLPCVKEGRLQERQFLGRALIERLGSLCRLKMQPIFASFSRHLQFYYFSSTVQWAAKVLCRCMQNINV